MILINLLPHREVARKRRREAFQASLLASFFGGANHSGCDLLVAANADSRSAGKKPIFE